MSSQTWVVVLAGGEGTRIQPLIKRCLGFPCPKQYFAFCGKHSMLEHTYARAVELVGSERIITVIGSGHRIYLKRKQVPGLVMEQPMSRGTLAGVLLPASHILTHDPNATVLIFPSDHFIWPKTEFIKEADKARDLAEALPEKLILMAAKPDIPEPDYGWVEPGRELSGLSESGQPIVREVRSFCEKPGTEEAKGYLEKGFLWNTMIIAAKLKSLWSLGKRLIPEVVEKFEAFSRIPFRGAVAQRLPEEPGRLVKLYNNIPTLDFSSTLLTKAPSELAVMPLQNVMWSDWGRPERVFDSLRKIGKRPLFLRAARV